jgi:hypothetical protein
MVRHSAPKSIVIVVGFALLQPWVLAIASTPNLVVALRVLPALWVFHWLRRGKGSKLRLALPTIALSVLGYASGYDWATTVPAMAAAVCVYWAINNGWTYRRFISVAGTVIASTVGALMLTIGLHFVQLWSRFGSRTAAWSTITYPLSKRAGAGLQSVIDPLLLEAQKASPDLVLKWYLGMPALFPPAAIPGLRFFSVGSVIVVVLTILCMDLRTKTLDSVVLQRIALGCGFLVSLLGPLGWFLLFRPSVYIHTHLDGAIWYLPTIPLGLSLIMMRFGTLQPAHKRLRRVTNVSIAGAVISLILLYMISSSLVAR